MTLGPTLILLVPYTEILIRHRTYLSGNTCGAVYYWSDGYIDAPFLPPFDTFLLRSEKNDQVFWLEKAKVVARQVDPMLRMNGEKDKYDHLPFAIRPTEKDYLYAAKNMVEDFDEQTARDRSYMCRQQAIYVANDALRLNPNAKLSKMTRDNISEFIDLHVDLNPEQRLLRTEYFRELGDFRMAMIENQHPLPEGYEPMQTLMNELILARNSVVQKLDFNPNAHYGFEDE